MVNQHKLGVTLGAFAGATHLVWVMLVLFGWAQPLVGFIFRLHMVSPAHTILAFNWGSALLLVALTSVIGYVVGNVLGMIWNKVK